MGAKQSNRTTRRGIVLLASGALLSAGFAQVRVISTILPGLYYSANCESALELHNLAQRTILIDVAAHRSDGSLAPLKNSLVNRIRLHPGQRQQVHLDVILDEAWAEIVEYLATPSQRPGLAIAATTACHDGSELRTVQRPVAYASANPSFQIAFDQAPRDASQILVLNPSETAVQGSACYSAGHLVSNDHGEMIPLCSATLDLVLPPYNSTRLDVERDGRVLVSLRTIGEAVVLQMLKPAALRFNLFRVDSSIRFDTPSQ